ADSGARAVIGLDIDPGRLHKARLRLGERRGVRFAMADLQRPWPVRENTYDLIVCVEVLEHIHPTRQETFLHEASKALRTKGKLVLTTPNGQRWLAKETPPTEECWTTHAHWHEPSGPELDGLSRA